MPRPGSRSEKLAPALAGSVGRDGRDGVNEQGLRAVSSGSQRWLSREDSESEKPGQRLSLFCSCGGKESAVSR